MNDLIQLEKELLQYLGFSVDMYPENKYPEGDYEDVAKKYDVDILEHEHETKLEEDHGPVFFLKNFKILRIIFLYYLNKFIDDLHNILTITIIKQELL